MTRSKFARLTCLFAAIAVPVSAPAATKTEKPSADLLEGLDDLLLPPQQQTPAPPGAASPWAPDEKLLNELLEDSLEGRPAGPALGEDIGKPSGASLEGIEQSMDQATELIGARGRSVDTAEVQAKIVSDLDELIKKMEKQCSSCSQCNNPQQSSARQQSKRSQAKPSPGQPQQTQQASSSAQQSQMRLGSPSEKDADALSPNEMMKEVWGHLPERVREQMLQSSSDEFLPKYRDEIEKYFERLAKEEADRQ